MIIPADIHTHRQPEVPGEAIVNCFPETFVPQQEGCILWEYIRGI